VARGRLEERRLGLRARRRASRAVGANAPYMHCRTLRGLTEVIFVALNPVLARRYWGCINDGRGCPGWCPRQVAPVVPVDPGMYVESVSGGGLTGDRPESCVSATCPCEARGASGGSRSSRNGHWYLSRWELVTVLATIRPTWGRSACNSGVWPQRRPPLSGRLQYRVLPDYQRSSGGLELIKLASQRSRPCFSSAPLWWEPCWP
jgi:hypothetical protein